MINIQQCDFIELKDLEVRCQIGVHTFEKTFSQRLKLDIKIYYDFRQINDEINDTIDYSVIVHDLKNILETQTFELLETFANFIAQWLNKNFKTIATDVLVKKYHIVPSVNYVSVRAFRWREETSS